MKLKISSDGTVTGTKVLDENGKCIENISFLSISADAEIGMIRATIELVNPEFEYEGPGALLGPTDHVYITREK